MDWMDKLKEYAPSIVTAIATGGATLPQLAMKAVSDVLGDDVRNEQDLAALVSGASPETMLKLKQADNAFAISMRQLDVELEQSELKDMQHAREKNANSRMPAVICCALTGMVAAGAWMLFTLDIPDGNKEIAYLLFGTLLAKWGDSIAYWVGTTRSSAQKTMMIKSN